MPDVPPLADLGPDDLDQDRIPVIVAASLAHSQDESLYDQYVAGKLAGRFAATEWDDDGFMQVTVEIPLARIHYGMLWRLRPLDLASTPPVLDDDPQ